MTEKIIVARGEISGKDLAFIVTFLGKQGLSTEIIDIDHLNELRAELRTRSPNLPYSFSEINSREQYLVKEHFHELSSFHAAEFTPTLASLAFGFLVDDRLWSFARHREVSQTELGIIIEDRVKLGFPKLGNNTYQRSNRFALQVGSFLDTATDHANGQWDRSRGFRGRAGDFVDLARDELEQQLGL